MTHDCNTYIINDNEFVRDFEGMYKAFSDPWDQTKKSAVDFLNVLALESLDLYLTRADRDVNSILDLGCADGYHSEKLLSLGSGAEKYLGVDISPTVIKRAILGSDSKKYKFEVGDIREFQPEYKNHFDLIFSGKTLYYVAPEIDSALANIMEYLNDGGLLAFTYNTREDAFSNRWLTLAEFLKKLDDYGLKKLYSFSLDQNAKELEFFGCYQAS